MQDQGALSQAQKHLLVVSVSWCQPTLSRAQVWMCMQPLQGSLHTWKAATPGKHSSSCPLSLITGNLSLLEKHNKGAAVSSQHCLPLDIPLPDPEHTPAWILTPRQTQGDQDPLSYCMFSN